MGTTRSAGTRQTDKKVLASHPPRHYIKSLDLITITSKMSQEDKKATLLRRMRKQKGGDGQFRGRVTLWYDALCHSVIRSRDWPSDEGKVSYSATPAWLPPPNQPG